MSRPGPVIAIDGPAASGKGTLARRLACGLRLPYLDTGLLYRAVARALLDAGNAGVPDAAIAAANVLTPSALARSDLRAPEIDAMASRIAAWPGLRAALLDTQRRFASGGAVLDGRDIGSVVFPDADVKLFVTASAATRAGRRLRQRGEPDDPASVERERQLIEARDQADATRDVAPLTRSADALLLDTTALGADAAFAEAWRLVHDRLALPGRKLGR